MKKILKCYPFKDVAVELIEGFEAYDGNIGDEPGKPHKGIDYVLRKGDKFVGFEVFCMHDGEALQGVSKSWGNYVIVHSKASRGKIVATVYAHLRIIHQALPQMPEKGSKIKPKGLKIKAGTSLGKAGITGWTNRIVQLHLELLEKDLKTGITIKFDPYGLNARFSSGRYPQPNHTLQGLKHFWVSNNPPLARLV